MAGHILKETSPEVIPEASYVSQSLLVHFGAKVFRRVFEDLPTVLL